MLTSKCQTPQRGVRLLTERARAEIIALLNWLFVSANQLLPSIIQSSICPQWWLLASTLECGSAHLGEAAAG